MNAKSSSRTVAAKRSAHKMKLPRNFEPGAYSVICGRGKLSSASPGNKHLRLLVRQNLTCYSRAKTKSEKSDIVSSIINHVREASPGGAFVKKEANGEWWDVGDSFAREKIGCIFRDILHTQYRSSTRSKLARKKDAQKKKSDEPISPITLATLNYSPYNLVEDTMMSANPSTILPAREERITRSTIGQHCHGESLPNDLLFEAGPTLFSPIGATAESMHNSYCSSSSSSSNKNNKNSNTGSSCLYNTNRNASSDEEVPSTSCLFNRLLHQVGFNFSTNAQSPTTNGGQQSACQTTIASSLQCTPFSSYLMKSPTTLLLLQEDALADIAGGDEREKNLLFPDDLSDIFEKDDDNS